MLEYNNMKTDNLFLSDCEEQFENTTINDLECISVECIELLL